MIPNWAVRFNIVRFQERIDLTSTLLNSLSGIGHQVEYNGSSGMNVGEVRNVEGCRNGYGRTDGE